MVLIGKMVPWDAKFCRHGPRVQALKRWRQADLDEQPPGDLKRLHAEHLIPYGMHSAREELLPIRKKSCCGKTPDLDVEHRARGRIPRAKAQGAFHSETEKRRAHVRAPCVGTTKMW